MSSKNSTVRFKTAWRALRRLLANPEATEEVFTIVRALSGSSLQKGLKRFASTGHGRYVLENRIDLLQTLQNKDYLSSLPANSLGRHYLNFIEKEKISAGGLVDASDKDITYAEMGEDLTRFATRQRDTHDLWHTLTQYGRDELGELCLLAFTYAQNQNPGIAFIILAGLLKMRTRYGLKIFSAVYKAYRSSKRAKWLPEQNWEELLERPIEDVRQFLKIHPPVHYQQLLSNPAVA